MIAVVLTDSGGVQGEACIPETFCVTLLENTERPDVIEVSSSILAGTNIREILACAREMLKRRNAWRNPFGDRTVSRIIVTICKGFHLSLLNELI